MKAAEWVGDECRIGERRLDIAAQMACQIDRSLEASTHPIEDLHPRIVIEAGLGERVMQKQIDRLVPLADDLHARGGLRLVLRQEPVIVEFRAGETARRKYVLGGGDDRPLDGAPITAPGIDVSEMRAIGVDKGRVGILDRQEVEPLLREIHVVENAEGARKGAAQRQRHLVPGA